MYTKSRLTVRDEAGDGLDGFNSGESVEVAVSDESSADDSIPGAEAADGSVAEGDMSYRRQGGRVGVNE